MEIAVKVKNLSFKYPDGTLALEDVNMEVYAGEIVAIVGPNGAGKTTLLLCLNGTLRGSGSVQIFGKAVEEYSVRDLVSRIGLVFQDPDDQLFMSTLYDDIAFGPINLGLDEKEVKKRVEAVLGLGLDRYLDKPPHHLSYGEKRRAALAAVLAMKPKILVLDEPTANLDPRGVKELLRIVREANREGTTVIFSTHNIGGLTELASRVYLLKKRVIGEGGQEILSDKELLGMADLL